MDTIKDLSKLYKKSSYLDMYGGSVFMTILALFIFFIVMSYFSVMKRAKPIKKDWANQRCNPSVIPFAGLINKPPNQSAFSYTGDNFNHCLNNILASITSDFIQPIDYVVNTFTSTIKGFINDIQSVRKRFSSMIGNFAAIDTEIMGRILNFLMPIQKMIIKLKDMIGKVNGVLVANLYTIITGYLGIKAFIGAFVKIMIEGLFILIGIIVPLLLFFFTAPIAIPFLIIFGVIAGFTIAVIIGLEDILHMSTSSVPSKPHCFDPFTIVQMNDGNIKMMQNIRPGDILMNNNKVTGVFKVKRCEDMYCYNNVIVSGSHNVFQHGQWIQVKDLITAHKLEEYSENIIYCLNTEKHIIELNDTIFADWDDIDDFEIYDINRNLSNQNIDNEQNPIHNDSRSKIHIRQTLKTSYPRNTIVTTINDNGKSCFEYIQDIQVCTRLNKNNEVIGVVQMLREIDNEFQINGGEIKTQKLFEKEYHILTTTGKFKLGNNEEVEDYNCDLEKML